MTTRLAVGRFLAGPEEWNRRRLQLLLAVAVGVALAVVAGIVWSIYELIDTGPANTSGDSEAGGALSIAAGASQDPVERAQAGPLASGTTATIRVPQTAQLGPAQVGTGLPETTEGAIAQLIAIDQRAIGSGSVVTAQDVIAAWATPGGPTAESWSVVAAIRMLLESAGLPANGSGELTINLEPQMVLVRDAAHESATVCIDFILTVSVRSAAPDQIATADCQHMTWQQNRWIIGPGPEPAQSPSLWPGTQESYDAGYLWLEVLP
ncbi:MAG: hypothetical protein ACSLEW_12055 [Nocardioides sp.]